MPATLPLRPALYPHTLPLPPPPPTKNPSLFTKQGNWSFYCQTLNFSYLNEQDFSWKFDKCLRWSVVDENMYPISGLIIRIHHQLSRDVSYKLQPINFSQCLLYSFELLLVQKNQYSNLKNSGIKQAIGLSSIFKKGMKLFLHGTAAIRLIPLWECHRKDSQPWYQRR